MDGVRTLKAAYAKKRRAIQARMNEFARIKTSGSSKRMFEELCYCILTANTSAKMGMDVMKVVCDSVHCDHEQNLAARLKGIYRFYNTRARYICATRKYLQRLCAMDLAGFLDSFGSVYEIRKFFAKNKNIKGLGMKESSHFLRNIGYRGLAILDKHILRTMAELGLINSLPKTLNYKTYLRLEKKLKQFADETGIDFDELDLLLWSEKTGSILK